MNKKTIYILIIFFLFSVMGFSSDTEKIVVTSSIANIRLTPGLDGELIKKAQKGEEFIVLNKNDSWYKIALAVDKKGDPEFGYIHSSIVKIVPVKEKGKLSKISTPEKKDKEIVKKPKKEKVVIKKNRIKFDQEKLFSGFYLKGGVITSPKIDSFGDKWIIALGFDKPIGSYMAWGLEFQPYYRNYSEDAFDLTMHNLSSNIFLNAKGGVNLGKFFEPLKFFTLYGGLGVGTSLSFSYVDIAGVTGTDFAAHFAWHYMFGGEFLLGKMNIIVELQGVRVIDPDIDPSTQSYGYFMLGIRF